MGYICLWFTSDTLPDTQQNRGIKCDSGNSWCWKWKLWKQWCSTICCDCLSKYFIMSKDFDKVEKILNGSLDSIPSPSVKIQIMGRKVCLRWKGKTLLGIVNKLLKTKSWYHPAMLCLITSSKHTVVCILVRIQPF